LQVSPEILYDHWAISSGPLGMCDEVDLVRVMTFNLRFENDLDGDNSWASRRDLLIQTIRKYRPHVIGTQEGKPAQLAFLGDHLTGYRISAELRHWDDYCQYPTLFYWEELFRLVEGDEFWLSETPSVHLSKSWDSAFPRMISSAHLEVKETRRRLWFSVTHLDHISERARIEGARMIRDWTLARRAPTVLAGDFNDAPGSETHRILTLPEGPFLDSWERLGRVEDESSFTQHGFTGIARLGRIDWILITPEFRVVDAAIGHDQKDGRYPSDHFPYMVDLELNESS
jgi:endonuclease/exonuclease/phosphatase family metal-dependent hydrolase